MKSWIKLYVEILRDPKMGRLTDRQYRTCINLFLLAGQVDEYGTLPPIDDIAWQLRADPGTLREDMDALARVGILSEAGGVWGVTRFADRQARNPSETPDEVKRRVAKHRQNKTEECNDDVTACNVPVTPCNDDVTVCNDIDKNRIEENREELEVEENREELEVEENRTDADKSVTLQQQSSFVAQAMTRFMNSIGLVSDATQAQDMIGYLDDLEARGAQDWWQTALDIAAAQNKRSWGYVRGILRRCLDDGKTPVNRNAYTPPGAEPKKRVVKIKSDDGTIREVLTT